MEKKKKQKWRPVTSYNMRTFPSLFHILNEYGENGRYPYHMPGHKRNGIGELPCEFAKIDITEIEGFDNLHDAEGILKRSQEYCAKVCHAEETHFLVGGSTAGILSAISTVVPKGEKLLITRGAHKSAYHAMYLREIRPAYLNSSLMEAYDICDAVTPEEVQAGLNANPDAKAVLIVSPTYEGRIAQVDQIADIVHERGIPLIVDEAHGAHLGFSSHTAPNSNQQGADLVIQSVHKTLPAPTQTALLHVNGDLVNRALLHRYLQMYQTSSPSYPLMAGIENAISWMDEHGEEAVDFLVDAYRKLTEELKACKHLSFVPYLPGQNQDVGKLVISLKKVPFYAGAKLAEDLRNIYKLEVEMVAATFCLAMFTVGDGTEGFDRMRDALLAIDHALDGLSLEHSLEEAQNISRREFMFDVPTEVLPLAKAWDLGMESGIYLPLDQCIGKCSGDYVNLYPPGTPILVPGELFTDKIAETIRFYQKAGLDVKGERDGKFLIIES